MRAYFKLLTVIPALLLLPACSTVMEGKVQTIAIDTAPAGAECVVKSNDDVLGIVKETPGLVKINRGKNDLLVECKKAGYFTSKKKNLSDMSVTSLGNMAFLQFGFIGSLFDSANGTNYKYDSKVMVELEKDPTYGVAQQSITTPIQPLQQMYLVQLPVQGGGMQTMLVQPSLPANQVLAPAGGQETSPATVETAEP